VLSELAAGGAAAATTRLDAARRSSRRPTRILVGTAQTALVVTVATTVTMCLSVSAGLMPTEARGNYFPEPPYLRETKTYHSQPLESIRHAGNYFVPISIRPIFCCRSYVKLLDYRRAEKNFSTSGGPLRPEARGICHICHMVNPALLSVTIRYDTIRDAILTCARKLTRVILIYRTEPTIKKCKNRKTKRRKHICSEITVNSLGNPCSESRRRKWKGCSGKDLQKRKGLSLE